MEFQKRPEAQSLAEEQASLRCALGDPTRRLLVRDEESGGYLDTNGRSVDVLGVDARGGDPHRL